MGEPTQEEIDHCAAAILRAAGLSNNQSIRDDALSNSLLSRFAAAIYARAVLAASAEFRAALKDNANG